VIDYNIQGFRNYKSINSIKRFYMRQGNDFLLGEGVRLRFENEVSKVKGKQS